MAREINLTSNEWCNIIFEGKNKEYGAYVLRNESSKRHYLSFLGVALFALLLFSLPMLSKALGMNKPKVDLYGEEVILAKLPPPEKNKEPVKPLIEEPERPKTAPAIKFTAPVIKPDDQVKPEDEIPPKEVVDNFKGLISTVNNVGEDVNGVDPATVNMNNHIDGESQEDNNVHDMGTIEIQPKFPGGESDLMSYLNKNIKYPVVAQENNIQGKVTIQFIVGKDGSIEDVQVARGVDRSLDAEALRVIKLMPKWIPGKQGGKAVRVKYFVPVSFKLQ